MVAHFQKPYPAKVERSSITKEDPFFYIYGLLHSPDYRGRYADNLGKEIPRIPAVKTYADFRAFSQAGRDLAHWHLNYETVPVIPAWRWKRCSPQHPLMRRRSQTDATGSPR